tara:strand:- start:542 stop:808 length:267 start_codon:yes stop_codon:yes gene_type:complete
MKTEIQDTTVNLSVKSIATIATVLFLMIGEYIVLHRDIDEAMREPLPEVTKLDLEYNVDKLWSAVKINAEHIEDLEKEIDIINGKPTE